MPLLERDDAAAAHARRLGQLFECQSSLTSKLTHALREHMVVGFAVGRWHVPIPVDGSQKHSA